MGWAVKFGRDKTFLVPHLVGSNKDVGKGVILASVSKYHCFKCIPLPFI